MRFWNYEIVNGYRSHTPKGFYDKVRGHLGIDAGCPVNTELSVPWETTCVCTRKQNEMGNCIYLQDFDGNIAVFAHLKEFKVQKGEIVRPNAVFGLSGNTGGKTTAPHCHFEVIAKTPEKGGQDMYRKELSPYLGYNIDPVKYWQSMSRASAFQRMTSALRRIYARIHRNLN